MQVGPRTPVGPCVCQCLFTSVRSKVQLISSRTFLGGPAIPVLAPHEVLGVPAAASAHEVRLAFRRRALESHPDKGGSTSEFRRVIGCT